MLHPGPSKSTEVIDLGAKFAVPGIHDVHVHPAYPYTYKAVKIFTLGGAQVTMREKENGSIEVGKDADMIVLDRNLFAMPVENIDGTTVLTTIFGGKAVYAVPKSAQ
jgi:predicted amidohydrolase YtcJ